MNFSFCTVVKDKPFSRADKIDQTAGFIILRHPAIELSLRVSSSAIKLGNQSYLGNTVLVPHVATNSFYVTGKQWTTNAHESLHFSDHFD